MARKKKEIKVKVIFTDGYAERFTRACCEVLAARKNIFDAGTGIGGKK